MTADTPYSGMVAPVPPKAPVKAMWICMILALALFVAPIPFTIVLAAPLDLAAFVLAIMCITRSRVGHGVIGLIGTTVVALVLYLVSWGLMAVGAAALTESAISTQQTAAVRAVASATDAPTVQASALLREFGANADAARGKWQGRIVRVEGTVDSSIEMFGNAAVILSPTASSPGGVTCFFPKGRSDVAALKKGDTVAILGQCEMQYGGVMLFGAKLAE